MNIREPVFRSVDFSPHEDRIRPCGLKSTLRRTPASRTVGWLVAAVCLVGTLPQRAVAQRFNDIEVTALPQPAAEGRAAENHAGYVEDRLVLENHSDSQDHEVRLTFPARSLGAIGEDMLTRDSRTVQVAKGNRQLE